MSSRPPFVQLRLTDPPFRGELVRQVQHALRGYGIEQDGEYGCQTANAVAEWKWRAGAPFPLGVIEPDELLVLLTDRKAPADWIKRRDENRRDKNGRLLPVPLVIDCPKRSDLRLRFIPRDQWCIYESRGTTPVTHGPGIDSVVHWQGPGKGATGLKDSIDQANSFARYHIYTLGWNDIGYNYLIPDCPEIDPGLVLVGRGPNAYGAHSGHPTANRWPGVLVMCGVEDPVPSEAQIDTLVALREHLKWGKRWNHSEWNSTSCPGPWLSPWVRAHR